MWLDQKYKKIFKNKKIILNTLIKINELNIIKKNNYEFYFNR